MDLRDPRARWVEVEFEISPANRPYQLQSVYSERVRAWLEPTPQRDRVHVTIDATTIEEHLLSEQKPKRGSFSDFVWVFDVETGHVLSATVSGTVFRTLNWGIARSSIEARVAAEMGSARVAGFKPPLQMLGNVFHRFCSDPESKRCTLIEGQGYDFESGYVNAVGRLKVGSRIVSLRIFSPLGEAVFSELRDPELAPDAPGSDPFQHANTVRDTMVQNLEVSAPPSRLY